MYQRRLDLKMEGEPERPQQPVQRELVDLSEFEGLESPWGEVQQVSGSPVHSVPIEVFRAILKGEVTSWEDRPGMDYGDGGPAVVQPRPAAPQDQRGSAAKPNPCSGKIYKVIF